MTTVPRSAPDAAPATDADDSPTTATGAPARVRIPHAPGLDGLRGMAVAAVLVFHAGPAGWLPGGFLGVSLFFTLSGYLITALALTEVARDRTLHMAAFWARRARRLLPALILTCIGVAVASKFTDLGDTLRADLIAGLTYTSNWVLVIRGESYTALFEAPSPLVHLWSLAIEEQFYVVLPIVVWLLARRRSDDIRRRMAIGAGAVMVAGVALCLVVDDPTLAYYGTLNRAPEIAIGVLLAALTVVTRDRAPTWLTWAAGAAAVVTLWAWRDAAVTDTWIARGGLAAFAVASATLVWAASRPGPVSTALSWRPLRGLGLISYGLYLYHWPVVVLLSFPRVDWNPVPLFVARVAISLALAIASYVAIEQPIRRNDLRLPDRQVLWTGAGALATTILVVVLAVPAAPAPEAAAPAPAVVAVPPTTDASTPSDPATAAAEAAPPTVVLLGDSLPAFLVRDGGSALDPEEVTLVDGTLAACDGAADGAVARSRTGIEVPVPEGCTGWPTQYPPFFQQDVDVAVLMVGNHAVLDRRIDGEFVGPCDPRGAAEYADDVADRIAYLADQAERVVLVLPSWADELSQFINPPDYLDRADCVREAMLEAAEGTEAELVDFGAYLCPDGRDACRPVRTGDGMHLDPEQAPETLQWLIDEVTAER